MIANEQENPIQSGDGDLTKDVRHAKDDTVHHDNKHGEKHDGKAKKILKALNPVKIAEKVGLKKKRKHDKDGGFSRSSSRSSSSGRTSESEHSYPEYDDPLVKQEEDRILKGEKTYGTNFIGGDQFPQEKEKKEVREETKVDEDGETKKVRKEKVEHEGERKDPKDLKAKTKEMTNEGGKNVEKSHADVGMHRYPSGEKLEENKDKDENHKETVGDQISHETKEVKVGNGKDHSWVHEKKEEHHEPDGKKVEVSKKEHHDPDGKKTEISTKEIDSKEKKEHHHKKHEEKTDHKIREKSHETTETSAEYKPIPPDEELQGYASDNESNDETESEEKSKKREDRDEEKSRRRGDRESNEENERKSRESRPSGQKYDDPKEDPERKKLYKIPNLFEDKNEKKDEKLVSAYDEVPRNDKTVEEVIDPHHPKELKKSGKVDETLGDQYAQKQIEDMNAKYSSSKVGKEPDISKENPEADAAKKGPTEREKKIMQNESKDKKERIVERAEQHGMEQINERAKDPKEREEKKETEWDRSEVDRKGEEESDRSNKLKEDKDQDKSIDQKTREILKKSEENREDRDRDHKEKGSSRDHGQEDLERDTRHQNHKSRDSDRGHSDDHKERKSSHNDHQDRKERKALDSDSEGHHEERKKKSVEWSTRHEKPKAPPTKEEIREEQDHIADVIKKIGIKPDAEFEEGDQEQDRGQRMDRNEAQGGYGGDRRQEMTSGQYVQSGQRQMETMQNQGRYQENQVRRDQCDYQQDQMHAWQGQTQYPQDQTRIDNMQVQGRCQENEFRQDQRGYSQNQPRIDNVQHQRGYQQNQPSMDNMQNPRGHPQNQGMMLMQNQERGRQGINNHPYPMADVDAQAGLAERPQKTDQGYNDSVPKHMETRQFGHPEDEPMQENINIQKQYRDQYRGPESQMTGNLQGPQDGPQAGPRNVNPEIQTGLIQNQQMSTEGPQGMQHKQMHPQGHAKSCPPMMDDRQGHGQGHSENMQRQMDARSYEEQGHQNMRNLPANQHQASHRIQVNREETDQPRMDAQRNSGHPQEHLQGHHQQGQVTTGHGRKGDRTPDIPITKSFDTFEWKNGKVEVREHHGRQDGGQEHQRTGQEHGHSGQAGGQQHYHDQRSGQHGQTGQRRFEDQGHDQSGQAVGQQHYHDQRSGHQSQTGQQNFHDHDQGHHQRHLQEQRHTQQMGKQQNYQETGHGQQGHNYHQEQQQGYHQQMQQENFQRPGQYYQEAQEKRDASVQTPDQMNENIRERDAGVQTVSERDASVQTADQRMNVGCGAQMDRKHIQGHNEIF